MFEILILLTGTAILVAMVVGYQRTRDPLSPMMVFGPLLLFVYVYSPATLLWNGKLLDRFPDPRDLLLAGIVNLLGVAAFCTGAVTYSAPRGWTGRSVRLPTFHLSHVARRRILLIGLALGSAAVAGFIWLVHLSGGPVHVFTQPKPFLNARSGYLGELPMLALPALFLLAIAKQGRTLGVHHYVAALVIASPHLVMGTLGGRRGPAFLILSTLLICWYLVHNRRPSARTVLCGVVAAGFIMLFLISNRQSLYLGSQRGVNWQAFWQQVTLRDAEVKHESGQEYTVGVAMIVTSTEYQRFYWGRRYLAQIVVRPIPRQLWPTKYDDIGLGWMARAPGTCGFSRSEWNAACGFEPTLGAAAGFVADLYLEFSFLAIVFSYGLGRLYSYAWRQWVTQGRFWAVVYFGLMALAAYLAAQSVIAWLYRALILIVPAWMLWRTTLGRSVSSLRLARSAVAGRERGRPAPAPPRKPLLSGPDG